MREAGYIAVYIEGSQGRAEVVAATWRGSFAVLHSGTLKLVSDSLTLTYRCNTSACLSDACDRVTRKNRINTHLLFNSAVDVLTTSMAD